ncbi:hypothetical protein [Dehalococcoides mccartyi]|uniref:hypothetical protein n=1 Tax=Dehalococcoides mccartyi TaxID=61435 RepID=UPI002FC94966
MSIEADWITTRIDAAKKISPVPDAVSTQLTELLKGQLSERQLLAAEASTIAGLLISDIASPNQPSDKEEK